MMRSNKRYSTASHLNSAVKRAWARLVLGWEDLLEVLALHPVPLRFYSLDSVMRSDLRGDTGSYPNSAVKRAWARAILGWVTAQEFLMLQSETFCLSREML